MIYLDDAIEAIASRDETDGTCNVFSGKQVIDILKGLPSAEPKTPSNGSITCVKSEKMHDRTTDGLIRRQDVLHELDGCDYELKDWQRWKLKTMVRDIPSAEKAQLFGEDATSVCKCPCEYREPCDYCHYDAYRGHGCPAEEGLKDG